MAPVSTTRRTLLAGFTAALASPALAQPAAPRLPDTETTRAGGLTAWLIDPTTRYAHGVLGDAIEAGGFVVERGGRSLHHRLGPDAVFEDRRVRLVDLGGGSPAALVVKSYLRRGAALAAYAIGAEPSRRSPRARRSARRTAG
ncbi:hypothetical protein [Phreatobacter cathodiphilus]|uniref:Uncharacterized protein n=1 Tax=Phreatobacter cathodiphilus TaxID=1868589 RepID=A0A2S0NGQ2_9HYPH|nr:hypothetical protein [Phreatobacter cathodiphilus]AVO47349.1 hypothetical protein C6569_21160 [Phreatobacter cathodiphilus]